ncbi:TetR family transcriptional regulator [Enterobacterales bacterium CwR94]|nr:TetR family transcriptional regulator [Enterobacterales bacterium CwR94]
MARQSTQQRRDDILDAAIALFRTKGLMQTATRDLTETMGISRSHIYHYFPNWQALTLAALEKYMREDLQAVRATLQGEAPAIALLKLADNILPHQIDSEWLIYSDTWQASARIASYQALASQVTAAWNQLILEIIEAGCTAKHFTPVDAGQVARQISAVINGYADVLALNPTLAVRQQALNDISSLMNALLQPVSPLEPTALNAPELR